MNEVGGVELQLLEIESVDDDPFAQKRQQFYVGDSLADSCHGVLHLRKRVVGTDDFHPFHAQIKGKFQADVPDMDVHSRFCGSIIGDLPYRPILEWRKVKQ